MAEGVLWRTAAWRRSGECDARIVEALAFRELRKNHQNGHLVNLVMADKQGREDIRIRGWRPPPEPAIITP